VLLPLVYFSPAIIGQVALVPGDGWTSNLGVRVLLGRMLAQGELPLWNPYIFAGMPLLANVYTGALYPPNWLFAFLSPGVAVKVLIITTYHLALIGAYLYARCIGSSRLGALVTGIIFTFGGFTIVHLEHIHRLTAVVWLPWILLAIEHLHQRVSWRWVAFGALFVALQFFAGDPQMTLYTVLLSGAYTVFLLAARLRSTQRWPFLAAGLMMALCGLLLALIQLLPERELLQQGERAQLSYDEFAAYSLPPWQIVTLIFPYFFGGAATAPYKIAYWGEWNVTVTCGYVGLLGLMLALVAIFGGRRDQLVWFWAGVAVMAIVLAFGAYLPFGLNHLLYRIPVYNLFRGSYRHLYEFTFAMAMLAGLGLDRIVQMESAGVWRALGRSTAVVALLVIITALGYRFFSSALPTPRPTSAGSLTDPEALIPLLLFPLCVAVLWIYARRQSALASVALIIMLVVDLASFGHFFEWRAVSFKVNERLADPPTVRYIKERETDLSSFRILSLISLPYDYDYKPPHDANHEWLNFSNASIARGLQSVHGYDILRLSRVAALAGEIDLGGIVLDVKAVGKADQGLNLLNVKYLLRERRGALEPGRGPVYDGISFSQTPLHLTFSPGEQIEMNLGVVAATELAIISLLGRATHIPDGAPVLRIRLYARDGRVIERQMQAGRDTAEWAYDRNDVRSSIKHQRARVVESWPVDGYQGHRYLARLSFEHAEIERIEFAYLREDADLQIVRATLYDATTGTSTPLDDVLLPAERWRKLESFGEVELYENLKLMPRAWFVSHLAVMPSAEVLRVIKTGRMRDGAPFDPAQTALLELEDFGERAITLPPVGEAAGAEVKITSYEPHRIELETRHPQPGFLVLSEVYYRGWEARLDGQKTTIYRTNYALRGLAVPPGEHRIEFIFRAPTFRAGALYAALGAALLVVGAFVSLKRAGCQ
jgi:hypothetical protein